jgi:hypothetical protein
MGHQLYRHYDTCGNLLYVGVALCSVDRLAQHRCRSGWFDRIATVRIEHFAAEGAALLAEAKAIRGERPLFNLREAGLDDSNPAFKLIQLHGDRQAVADAFDVSREAIRLWLHKGIPADRALEVEDKTKNTAHPITHIEVLQFLRKRRAAIHVAIQPQGGCARYGSATRGMP